jgi:hypothetical protein
MEMYCPECMSPLDVTDGKTAICRAHNARFTVLFTRYPLVETLELAEAGQESSVAAPVTAADRLTAAYGGYVPPKANCSRHPDSAAVSVCHVCRTPICSTCLFVYPGGLHFCPSCATNPNPQISSKRKKMIWWSMGMGIFSLVSIAALLLIAGQMRGEINAQMFGCAFMLLSLVPSTIGLATGIGALDKRIKTPGIVWVGIITSGVSVVVWLLLTVVGLMK